MSSTGRIPVRAGGAYYTPPKLAHAIVGIVADEWRGARILEPQVGGGAFLQALYRHGLAGPGLVEVMDIDPDCRGMTMPGPHLRTLAKTTDDPVQTGFLVTDPQRRPDAVVGNPPFGVPRPAEKCTRCGGGGLVPRYRRSPTMVRCKKCNETGVVSFKRPLPTAELHVRHALEVADRWVLQLLRLAMLEAKERLALWRDTPLREVHVIVRRPNFMSVCPACCGSRVAAACKSWRPAVCEICSGVGEVRSTGTSGDSAAYAAFVWDHAHRGDPIIRWLSW